MNYTAGSPVTLQQSFFDSAGDPIDPAAVTLSVQDPGGTITTYNKPQLVNPSVGVYQLTFTAQTPGNSGSPPTYAWEWTSTTPAAVYQGTFTVTPSIIGTPLPVTLPDFTPASLVQINAAIASGALEVRFQDRTVTYRSMNDLMIARDLIKGYLAQMSSDPPIRQSRIWTTKGT